MNEWKFVHAADIHLDAPLVGLERYEGAPVDEIRDASRRALHNVVDVCLEEQAKFLIVAGDVFDGDWRDFNTGLFFNKQMVRLADEGIVVYLVRGNHDAASKITRSLALQDNVVQFSHRRPETQTLDELRVAVHGQSYATEAVRENLALKYPDPVPGYFNIGVLHTALAGAEGTSPYAPCSLGDLRSKAYQYWALGHMHRFEVLSEDPWIVMAGITQARHVREDGEKGALVVTVDDGEVTATEHRLVDVVRWVALDVDASGAETANEVVDRFVNALQTEAAVIGDRTMAARVRVTGSTRAHVELARQPDHWRNAIRAAAENVGTDVWVEKVQLRTRVPLDLDALAQNDDAVGGLVRSFRALRDGGDGLDLLARELHDVRQKLPEDLSTIEDGLDLSDPETLQGILEQAEQLLLSRLVGEEES